MTNSARCSSGISNVAAPGFMVQKQNRPPNPSAREGPMAGFRESCPVLADYTATAHRLAVPPRGERSVIVIIAIKAVAELNHVCLPVTMPQPAYSGWSENVKRESPDARDQNVIIDGGIHSTSAVTRQKETVGARRDAHGNRIRAPLCWSYLSERCRRTPPFVVIARMVGPPAPRLVEISLVIRP